MRGKGGRAGVCSTLRERRRAARGMAGMRRTCHVWRPTRMHVTSPSVGNPNSNLIIRRLESVFYTTVVQKFDSTQNTQYSLKYFYIEVGFFIPVFSLDLDVSVLLCFPS